MIIALNGSPRKSGNTAAMLQSALDGAASKGAETRLVHLRSLNYAGCASCFACKLKTGKHGRCAIKDDLPPLFEELEKADAILFGSPIYYGDVTAETLALEHRFLFSHMLYNKVGQWSFPRKTPSAFIYTFGAPDTAAESIIARFATVHACMGALLGVEPRVLWSGDAWQFKDYGLYEADMFDPEAKKRHKEEVFPADLRNAFNLGAELALG